MKTNSQKVVAIRIKKDDNVFVDVGINTFLWVQVKFILTDDLQVHLFYDFNGKTQKTSFWHNSKIDVYN